ncbi:MAG: hypothetical protein COA66_07250 [Arcobacter sp.]|nr:MAG: hypothetical protein COA66_07250 [Arcobacter sp.]
MLNDEIFTGILKEASTVNLIYLSFNKTLTKKMINVLFEKNIENINGNLLKNSLCEESKIREFLALKDKIYNICIAHNENLCKSLYEELFSLDDYDVNVSLFYNACIPKELKSLLASKLKLDI